jgi:hypothetical protein
MDSDGWTNEEGNKRAEGGREEEGRRERGREGEREGERETYRGVLLEDSAVQSLSLSLSLSSLSPPLTHSH